MDANLARAQDATVVWEVNENHLFIEVYCMTTFSLDNKKLGDIHYLRDFKIFLTGNNFLMLSRILSNNSLGDFVCLFK